jgi:large subunit ribosomal protein L10
MPSKLNTLVVQELKNEFSDTDTCIFVDFSGLSGRKTAELRSELRQQCGQNTKLKVVKTTLFQRALMQDPEGEAGPRPEALHGPTAVAYGADDPVVLARALADWAKKESLLPFKGGLLVGSQLSAERVGELAKIPPRAVLMGQVVGMIAAPLTSLLGVSQGVIRNLLGVVDALAKKREDGGSAAASEA